MGYITSFLEKGPESFPCSKRMILFVTESLVLMWRGWFSWVGSSTVGHRSPELAPVHSLKGHRLGVLSVRSFNKGKGGYRRVVYAIEGEGVYHWCIRLLNCYHFIATVLYTLYIKFAKSLAVFEYNMCIVLQIVLQLFCPEYNQDICAYFWMHFLDPPPSPTRRGRDELYRQLHTILGSGYRRANGRGRTWTWWACPHRSRRMAFLWHST